MNKLILAASLALSVPFHAMGAVEDEFDSLGGNTILIEKAKVLNPETTTTVVQERTVSRRNRVEIAPEYSADYGGVTYLQTQSLGLNLHYHINPRWSVGVKYKSFFNKLTPEGEALADLAYQDYQQNPANPTGIYPEVDHPKSETVATVSWYPFYGKLNLLDRSVVQFDGYFLAGAGSVEMKSGGTQTQLVGGGVGFWLNPKLTMRVETTLQKYRAQYHTGAKDLNVGNFAMQMGWML